ncbi:MAG: nitrite reductase [Aquificae bacterium]|nr:nitrite reductase [Aquificota bacterium]
MRRRLMTGLLAVSVGFFMFSSTSSAKEDYTLTPEEMEKAAQLYFDRCAGCHGMLRKGATGPNLEPHTLKKKGFTPKVIEDFIYYGTPGGMPDWGRQGVLTKEEIKLLAKYLFNPPPEPPERSLAQIKSTWKVYVPVDHRPTSPAHDRDWQNFFGVILRDVGKVAIIDGSRKELVNIVDTGFAVHILRASASGRYFYSIGRDGKVTLIDLWLPKPDKVAEVKACYDARSVDVSKYAGKYGNYKDKLAIVGCYWPPSFVIMDGQTLEPLKIVGTSDYTYDTNEFMRETRVASIVASHEEPEWVVNMKETGKVWLVDYSDIHNLKVAIIDAERFLHDGGWDFSKRYFLVAANMRNKVVVVDTVEKELEALVDTGTKPHPGRGANVYHDTYGPIWCTGHIGEGSIVCIGVDKRNFPEYAWKVVARIKLPGEGGGNLFVKTHPKVKYIFADRTLNPDIKLQRSFHVIDKKSLKVIKTIEVPKKYKGRVVHFDFDKYGTELWVSIWGKKEEPTAILVYDANTLKIKKAITGDWVRTPTGKFNVYNTMRDVY